MSSKQQMPSQQMPAGQQKMPPLNFITKLFYGFGSIAYGVKDNGFRTLLLLYYNQVVGLPAGLVSAAIMVALILDSVMDPIIGQISDTWHSRWGRRHPFMYAAALPSAISFLLLWNPPLQWSQTALLIYLVVVAVVVRSFITVYEIPSSALVSELTSDYDERTALMGYRYLFFFWGSLVLSLLTYRVLLQPDAAHPIGQLNPLGYSRYGWVAASMMLIAILVSTAGTQNRIPFLHRPPRTHHRRLGQIFKEMLTTLSHRSFWMVTAAALSKGMALGISGALTIYINTFVWHLKPTQIAILILDGFFSALLAGPFAKRMSMRYGKRATSVVFLILSFVLGVAPLQLWLLGWFWPIGSPYLVPTLFIQGVVFGTFGIGATVLTGSMIADVVEDSQRLTGRRSEGLFFSASSLMQKTISGFGVFGAGLILWIADFPQQAKPGQVSEDVLRSMVWMSIAAAAILFALASLFTAFYRIDRNSHAKNLRELADAQAFESPPIA